MAEILNNDCAIWPIDRSILESPLSVLELGSNHDTPDIDCSAHSFSIARPSFAEACWTSLGTIEPAHGLLLLKTNCDSFRYPISSEVSNQLSQHLGKIPCRRQLQGKHPTWVGLGRIISPTICFEDAADQLWILGCEMKSSIAGKITVPQGYFPIQLRWDFGNSILEPISSGRCV